MNAKSKHLYPALLLAVMLGLQARVFGQESPIDQERLNRDLRIMEGVLDKIFKGKSSHWYFNGHTKGVYLPGFGVVFHMSQVGPIHHDLTISLREQHEEVEEMAREVREQHDELRADMEKMREDIQQDLEIIEETEHLLPPEEELIGEEDHILLDSERIVEEEKKYIETFKKNIIVFFRNYSPAIGQLRPQDRIAILINLDDWKSVESENAFLTAYVTKREVDQYRRNQTRQSDFEKNIHFQQTDAESDIDMDISIMSEIFDRAMDRTSFWGSPSNSGIYLDGLGALLFMELPGMGIPAPPDVENLISIMVRDNEKDAVIVTPRERLSEEKKKDKEKIREKVFQEVQDELFELMASYGHTIRIKNEESVVLNVDLRNRLPSFGWGEKKPSRLILQLNKKDLDDFNRGIIPINILRQRLIRKTY